MLVPQHHAGRIHILKKTKTNKKQKKNKRIENPKYIRTIKEKLSSNQMGAHIESVAQNVREAALTGYLSSACFFPI